MITDTFELDVSK